MSKISYLALGLALCLLLVLPGVTLSARAAAEQQEPLPPRGPDLVLEEVPHLGPLSSRPAAEASLAPTQLPVWTRWAFESWRGNNWDIYTSNFNVSSQVRLTTDSAVDCCAQLDRGCGRIVFASDHSADEVDDYEIYVMNSDGSGVTRLTSVSGNDIYPAWSPDGTRITFQSSRDGQAEIYVMNADGSGQTRLTSDGGYDGHPDWSPDGTRIAFTSTRGGSNGIWVMDQDGSGQTQLAAQAYCESPAWSPDGRLIAYDADFNGDGWQELGMMNADGSNQQMVYDDPYGPHTDYWMADWSPDGRYVGFTAIHWVNYQGQWYWDQTVLQTWDSWTGYVWGLGNEYVNWHPDWQTLDTSAPASSVGGLSVISPGPVTVSWSGTDSGPAGLRNYDVQVKDGTAGAWTDWLLETTATSAAYPGLGGHTYYFRSRARDNAYNAEAWPAVPDAWTTVEALPPVSWVKPLPDFGPNGLAIRWSGYDPGDSGVQTYDVQVRDGPAGSWTDWLTDTTANSAPFQGVPGHIYFFRSRATDAAHNVETWPTGDGDTRSTLYLWALSGAARDNTGAPVGSVVVATTPASFLAIPSDIEGGYRSYVAVGAETYTVTWVAEGYTALPDTSFLRQGGLVLWNKLGSDDEVQHSAFGADGTIVGTQYAYEPARHGTGYVRKATFANYLRFPAAVLDDLHERGTIELWATPMVSQPIHYEYGVFGLVGTMYADPGVPGDFNVRLVWGDNFAGRGLYGAVKFDTTVAQTPSEPTQFVAAPFIPFHAAICWDIAGIDGTPDTIRVYRDGQIVGHTQARWNPNGTERHDIILGFSPDWGGFDKFIVDNMQIWVYAKTDFSTRFRETPSVAATDQRMGGEAELHVVMPPRDNVVQNWGFENGVLSPWLAGGGATPVVTDTQYHTGRWSALLSQRESSIAQRVTLSTTLRSPVLSFLALPQGDWSGTGHAFTVKVSDGLSTTTLLSQTTCATDVWNHTWFDLTPWAGQQVTISFTLSQEEETPLAWVYLDEVTVGSAYPDLWVSAHAPASGAMPGETVNLGIAYGNRGGVVASDVFITGTLPDELSFVSASPPPVTTTPSLVWQVGALPGKDGPYQIQVTTTLASTATILTHYTGTVQIEAASPELEMGNNLARATVFAGTRLHLPVILSEG